MSKRIGLVALALGIALTVTAAHAQSLFDRFDKNGDGIVEKSEVPRVAHKRFNELDADDDGRVTQEEAEAFEGTRQSTRSNGADRGSAPDYKDVPYNTEFERALMDIWTVDGATKAPVLVFFHGGGFAAGSKDVVSRAVPTEKLTSDGVAIVSVGYPFIQDFRANGSKQKAVEQIFDVTEDAIAFLRANADRYNIDPNLIIVSGSSAGAMITTHLAISEPQPGIAGGLVLNQPRGAERVLVDIDGGSLPLVMFTAYGPDNKMHPPSEAEKIYEHCRTVGSECAIYGTAISGLPELPADEEITAYAVDFILD